MWDRLLVDCRIATLQARPGDPLGIIDNGAIGIADGKIVRVGKRTELAGTRAKQVDALDGAWVTPGLIDCHTHVVFGGNRADEHAMRRAGATYEEIAKAGGGIASTVEKTKAASDNQLLEQSRARLHALMRGGCTTIEIKSGYGLDPKSEIRLLKIVRALGEDETVRIVPTLLALHALPPGSRDRRAHYVGEMVDKLLPTVARDKLASSVDAYCDTIAFTLAETERLFSAASELGLPVRLHAEQLSNRGGAKMAARYGALSADHLEHIDEAGVEAMAQAGMVAVLLPGAFTPSRRPGSRRSTCSARTACRWPSRPTATRARRPCCRRRWQSNMACTLFGLTPEEALAGMTVNAARALGLELEVGIIAPGRTADLAVWRLESLAELGYWIGLPGPERRIFAGVDA